MKPKLTHTASEHELALELIDPLLLYIKTDAFSRGDRPLTYAAALDRFEVDVPVRRLGRVLDGVQHILVSRGWPGVAAAGVTAYVVNAGSRKPGDGWSETWTMTPEEARAQARAYIRLLTLGPIEGD